MQVKSGYIIVLKNYSGHNRRSGQYGVVSTVGNETICFKWINDNINAHTSIDNVKIFRHKRLKEVAGTLQVGMKVICNADGSRITPEYYYGEIGEIQREETSKAFIWNNKHSGSEGIIQRPEEWLYTWMIKLNNPVARIVILDGNETEVEEDQEECSSCGHLFDKDDLKECCDGELYCEDCESENFIICDNCGKQVENDDEYSPENGGCYCQDCYDERYFHCHSCGNEHRRDDRCVGADDYDYCQDCYDYRFRMCDRCDETFFNDDLEYDDEGDQYVCSECRGVHDEDTGERVIHDYGFRPGALFNKCEHEKEDDIEKPLYMGIELEVQRAESYQEYARMFVKFLREQGKDKYFYLKNDSTLKDKGFEIVTHPFTLQYAHKNLGFRKILAWLKENKLHYGNTSGNCGLHVHISKNFFEDLDITKLRLFFKQNIEQLKLFSRREGIGMNYCKFETIDIKNIIQGEQPSGRYWALNLDSSRDTVEIRVFRGFIDEEWFIAVLQFVDAISHFVKKHGVTSFIYGEGIYKKNSWGLFLDWARSEGKYATMLKHMKGMELCV